ncbi:MAG: hypothetical protein QXS89_00415 [Sulfolobales archaeon]
MSQKLDILLRRFSRGEITLTDFLREITMFIPPGEDYGVLIGSTYNASYYIDRAGPLVISKNIDDNLPFLNFRASRINFGSIPQWLLEEINPCDIIRQIIDMNIDWLNKNYEDNPYHVIAVEISRIKFEDMCKEN